MPPDLIAAQVEWEAEGIDHAARRYWAEVRGVGQRDDGGDRLRTLSETRPGFAILSDVVPSPSLFY